VAHPARRRQPPSIKALPVAPNWIYATFMCVGANSRNRCKLRGCRKVVLKISRIMSDQLLPLGAGKH